METADVSVVMHTRNRADMLPLSLAHLESQTSPAGRFEILIIDEGSTGDTADVLERYASGAPVRIKRLTQEGGNLGRARNRAVEMAAGRWILFLDDELLAGPRLVESHVEIQRREGGGCAAAGNVQPHPQIEVDTFMRWRQHGLVSEPRGNQPLRFIDWRAWNLSVPRDAFLEAGGFDESFTCAGLEDLELAWRLENKGLTGVYSESACAYAWQPTSLDREQRRSYAEGYTLTTLIEKTQSDIVRQRYVPEVSFRHVVGDSLAMSICRLASTGMPSTNRVYSLLSQRALRHAFRKGYRDAVANRPPRA